MRRQVHRTFPASRSSRPTEMPCAFLGSCQGTAHTHREDVPGPSPVSRGSKPVHCTSLCSTHRISEVSCFLRIHDKFKRWNLQFFYTYNLLFWYILLRRENKLWNNFTISWIQDFWRVTEVSYRKTATGERFPHETDSIFSQVSLSSNSNYFWQTCYARNNSNNIYIQKPPPFEFAGQRGFYFSELCIAGYLKSQNTISLHHLHIAKHVSIN